mmetsp:Transcript_3305/g.9490  ORF Transcript_3305/g.9490 Transcript_3305/m.9490 type:complete len:234 (-) Transcript_3305:1823-2524(-)
MLLLLLHLHWKVLGELLQLLGLMPLGSHLGAAAPGTLQRPSCLLQGGHGRLVALLRSMNVAQAKAPECCHEGLADRLPATGWHELLHRVLRHLLLLLWYRRWLLAQQHHPLLLFIRVLFDDLLGQHWSPQVEQHFRGDACRCHLCLGWEDSSEGLLAEGVPEESAELEESAPATVEGTLDSSAMLHPGARLPPSRLPVSLQAPDGAAHLKQQRPSQQPAATVHLGLHCVEQAG